MGTWGAIVEACGPFDISGQGRSCQEGDVGAETGRTQKSRLYTGEGSPAMAAAQRPTLGMAEKDKVVWMESSRAGDWSLQLFRQVLLWARVATDGSRIFGAETLGQR